MSATIHGLTDLTFGIPAAESGLAIQRFSVTQRADKREVRQTTGEFAAVIAGVGIRAEITFSGVKRGSGIATNIGAALTLATANKALVDTNGLTSTVIVLDEVTNDASTEDFIQTSGRATAYALS